MVPKAGLEPARVLSPTVFETVASAYSATSAWGEFESNRTRQARSKALPPRIVRRISARDVLRLEPERPEGHQYGHQSRHGGHFGVVDAVDEWLTVKAEHRNVQEPPGQLQ